MLRRVQTYRCCSTHSWFCSWQLILSKKPKEKARHWFQVYRSVFPVRIISHSYLCSSEILTFYVFEPEYKVFCIFEYVFDLDSWRPKFQKKSIIPPRASIYGTVYLIRDVRCELFEMLLHWAIYKEVKLSDQSGDHGSCDTRNVDKYK